MAILRVVQRPWLCVCVNQDCLCVRDCSTGVSVMPPVTLRFPSVRRHVTSSLCFPAQEYLSKNVFLFKGSQQPSFLLCLAAQCVCACVCTLVMLSIVGPQNRNPWDADEDEDVRKGVYFPLWFVPIYSQGSCFITHSKI